MLWSPIGYSCPRHLQTKLLQCALCRTAIAGSLETSWARIRPLDCWLEPSDKNMLCKFVSSRGSKLGPGCSCGSLGLECFTSAQYWLPLKMIWKLKFIQNATSSMLTDIFLISSCDSCYADSILACDIFRVQMKLLVIIYKTLYCLELAQLTGCLALQKLSWTLRTLGDFFLHLSPLAEAWWMGTWERAFSVVASHLWSSLPWEVTLAPCLL